ncbi:MAG: hypothetical protein EPO08_21060 [Rhodospirillaceae bacterium]|nr:MAG: hypothetical protein EPO08_21060 [Rhodospirillaceae bacterium]
MKARSGKAKRSKSHRRFGSPAATHREKAAHAFMDASHHAAEARKALLSGHCGGALDQLLIARGALEEGRAHEESEERGGRGGDRAERTVEKATHEFADRCIRR